MQTFRRLLAKLSGAFRAQWLVGLATRLSISRLLKLTTVAIGLIIIPVGFNACGEFNAINSRSLSSVLNYESAPNTLNGDELYSSKCAVCHQPLQQSQKQNASVALITNAVSTIPEMSLLKGHLTSDEILAIYWVLQGNPSVESSKQTPFACATNRPPGHSEMRRLTAYEYKNTIQDLFGSTLTNQLNSTLAGLPADAITDGLDNIDPAVSSSHISAYMKIATQIGDAAVANPTVLSTIAGACATSGTVDDNCTKSFIANFGKKVFRRPLTTAEIATVFAISKDASTASSDALEGFRISISYLLQSPFFVYRIEMGSDLNKAETGTFKLTSYEVATRLSYLIVGTLPDPTLMGHADDNSIQSDATYKSELERLLSDPRAKIHFRHFYEQVWKTPGTHLVNYSQNFLQGTDVSQLNADAKTELNDFVDYIVWKQKGNFSDLMTSDVVFPRTASLASIYNTPVWSESSPILHAPANSRSGLLTRVSLLAGGLDQAHPLVRGAFIRRKFLCGVLPPPSPSAFPPGTLEAPAPQGSQSFREVFEKKTSDSACMRCHSMINPLGFALGNFDNLGRFQTTEKIFDMAGMLLGSQRVDAVTSPSIDAPVVVSVNGAQDLGHQLANSQTAPKCFVTEWYEYAVGRTEDNNDGCSMNAGFNGLTRTNGSVIDMIRETALSPSFRLRRVQ